MRCTKEQIRGFREKVLGMFTIILISSVLLLTGIACGEPVNLTDRSENFSESGHRFIGSDAESDMNSLIILLRDLGLDISYGDANGTIFSMVDESLTRIISDLSTGNTDGFMDIPLIQETIKYLGISPEQIMIRPEDAPASLEAVDRYKQKYSDNQKGVTPS